MSRWPFPENYLSYSFHFIAACGMNSTHILYLTMSIPVTCGHLLYCMCVFVHAHTCFCVLFGEPVHIREWSQLPSSSSVSFTFGVIVSLGQDPSWQSHLKLTLYGQSPLQVGNNAHSYSWELQPLSWSIVYLPAQQGSITAAQLSLHPSTTQTQSK